MNKTELADFKFPSSHGKNHVSIPKDFKYSGIPQRQHVKCQNITLQPMAS